MHMELETITTKVRLASETLRTLITCEAAEDHVLSALYLVADVLDDQRERLEELSAKGRLSVTDE